MRAGSVLVTGATGFVGIAVVAALRASGHVVRRALRTPEPGDPIHGVEDVVVGDIADLPDWDSALQGADRVVHLAARVHVMREQAPDPDAAFARVNVDATRRLARAAASAGIHRFVYLSSVKVHGEHTVGRPFTEDDAFAPEDAYGRSKARAEAVLREDAGATGLDVVILRPPLVYGPGAGANMLALLRVVDRGLPLPFGAVHNRRSFVGVANLADAVVKCLVHPAATAQTFLVDDGVPRSTPDLVRTIAAACGRRACLWPVPPSLLRAAAAVAGRAEVAGRLLDDLEIDASHLRSRLGWKPPCTFEAGIADMVEAYRGPARSPR